MQPLTAPEAPAQQAADGDALKAVEGAAAVDARAAASEQQEDTGENKAAMGKEATDKAHSPDHDASLAKKVTEYILDNQDDTAQEERWRTTMKRETMKRFREQREHVQKIETEMQTSKLRMDEKMDQLIKVVTHQNSVSHSMCDMVRVAVSTRNAEEL